MSNKSVNPKIINKNSNQKKSKNKTTFKREKYTNISRKKTCCPFLYKLYNNNISIHINKGTLFKYNSYYDNFEDAIKYEKRKICKLYIIFIVVKEKIINTFCFLSPLEVKSLHICLLIFIYSCNFSLNSLFYFSDNISDKYHNKGKSLFLFILLNNLSICLISTILCNMIVLLLKYLINSTTIIERTFREEEKNLRDKKNKFINKKMKNTLFIKLINVYSCLKKKFVLFIFIELILLLFFFYFTTAFCEVYKSTQISWVIDCFISFVLSIAVEIVISTLITILYILTYKKKIKWLFCFALALI